MSILKLANNILKNSWLNNYFNQELAILKLADLPKALEDKLNFIQRSDSDFQLIKQEIENLNQKHYGKAISILTSNPNISFNEFKGNFEITEKSEGQKIDTLKMLLTKYPDQAETIKEFANNDPSKSLKYLIWQTKMFILNQAPVRELIDIANLFEKHNDKLDKKDINQYKAGDVATLRDTLFSFEEMKKERTLKEEAISCGNKELYRSETCIVKHIFNMEASCHYGVDTKWCISGGLNRNYFNDYDSNNVVFFFVLTKDPRPYNKIAIIYKRNSDNSIIEREIFDSSDNVINDLPDFLEKDKIYTITESVAKSHPKSIVAKLKSGEATEEEIEKLYNDVKDHEDDEYRYEIFLSISADRKTPQEILTTLSTMENYQVVRKNVAINSNTPAEALINLSTNNEVSIREAVVDNPNTPAEVLINLSKDKDGSVREGIALNLNAPADVLTYLSKDNNVNVIACVARNSNTPAEILTYLSEDNSIYVKACVAMNPNTTADVLINLSKDKDASVRKQIALNRNTPVEILTNLSKDEDYYVAEMATRIISSLPIVRNRKNKKQAYNYDKITKKSDKTLNPVKSVLDGFKSVSELWSVSTPELLKSEIRSIISKAVEKELDNDASFLLGKNRALELLSKFKEIQDKEQRRVDRINQQKLKAEILAEKEQIASEAKIELQNVVSNLILQDNLSAVQKLAIEYFRLVYLENKRDYEIASLFKGSTRDQRYQWKRRAIDIIVPLVSETAKKYISEKTKRKFAFLNEITKLANIFLYNTMETK